MRKKEVKKLWFHTIIFVLLIFSIMFLFDFFIKETSGVVKIILVISGGTILSLIMCFYAFFMLKWFRKMKQEKKPGNWDYLIRRYTLIFKGGVALLIFNFLSLPTYLVYNWIKN